MLASVSQNLEQAGSPNALSDCEPLSWYLVVIYKKCGHRQPPVPRSLAWQGCDQTNLQTSLRDVSARRLLRTRRHRTLSARERRKRRAINSARFNHPYTTRVAQKTHIVEA